MGRSGDRGISTGYKSLSTNSIIICPGASLARLEGNAAVETTLDRFAAMEPIEGHVYPPMPANLSYQPLPARLVPR